MILTGNTVKSLLLADIWKSNTNPSNLHFNPNSVDVTLSPYIYECKEQSGVLDPYTSNPEDFYELRHISTYEINPQQFILASVNETFHTIEPVDGKYFTQIYDGRSTIARLGLLTHVSAGYGDYGFDGAFTLEIVNNSPFKIKLHAGMRIGQIYFEQLDSAAPSQIYQGYNHSNGIPGLPRLGKDRF